MLSGGQRQRIAIARALIHNPKLLILDEPTSALDKATADKVCTLLAEISKECAVLVISHQSDIVSLSDIAYKMHDGKLELMKPAYAKDLKNESSAA